MKKLVPVATTAVCANFISILLYIYAARQPGGSGATLVFTILWMPALWVLSIAMAVSLTIKYRKEMLKKPILKWTIPALIFCTPLPLNLIYTIFTYSGTYLVSTGYNPKNGITIKTEEWIYTFNRKLAVRKFFKYDSENYSSDSYDSMFKKDSVWIYLNPKGDTVKIENYKNGLLSSSQTMIPKNK